MNTQLPAHLNRQSRGVAAQVASLGSIGQPPYLSIKGNAFTLVDAAGGGGPVTTYDQAGPYLDVVIVDTNSVRSKIYWGKDYDPNNTDPPLCFSDNGTAPSRNAQEPQHPTCGACRHNVIGSATSKISGKGIKACADTQKIAFVLPQATFKTAEGREVPLWPENFLKMLWLLRVPPNSLKPCSTFMSTVAKYKVNDRDMDVTDIITRVRFEPGVIGTLKFEPVGYIE